MALTFASNLISLGSGPSYVALQYTERGTNMPPTTLERASAEQLAKWIRAGLAMTGVKESYFPIGAEEDPERPSRIYADVVGLALAGKLGKEVALAACREGGGNFEKTLKAASDHLGIPFDFLRFLALKHGGDLVPAEDIATQLEKGYIL